MRTYRAGIQMPNFTACSARGHSWPLHFGGLPIANICVGPSVDLSLVLVVLSKDSSASAVQYLAISWAAGVQQLLGCTDTGIVYKAP